MRAMCVASQHRARPWLVLLAAVGVSAAGLVAAPQEQKGAASGVVVDFDTKLALPGATVTIVETGTEATTDIDGSFAFGDLDVGTYSVRVSYPGMIALTTTDVIVKSARTTHLTVAYRLVPAAKEDVTVTSGYFAPTADQPTHYTFGGGHTIRTGFEGKWVLIDYDLSIASYTDVLGRIIPASSRRVRGGDSTWSAFVDSSTALGSKLTLNVGLRADYYTYSRNVHASPRLSMSYALTDRTSLTASAGLFY